MTKKGPSPVSVPRPQALVQLQALDASPQMPSDLSQVLVDQEEAEKQAAREIQDAAADAAKYKKVQKHALKVRGQLHSAAKEMKLKVATVSKAKREAVTKQVAAQRRASDSESVAIHLKAETDQKANQVKQLSARIEKDKARLKRAAVVSKQFVKRTLTVAKDRIANANIAAQRLVRAAVAKARAMRTAAMAEAKAATKTAKAKAAEMNEDARSSLASDMRKQKRESNQSKASKAKFEKAEIHAWKAMQLAQTVSEAESRIAIQEKLVEARAAEALEQETQFETANAKLLE